MSNDTGGGSIRGGDDEDSSDEVDPSLDGDGNGKDELDDEEHVNAGPGPDDKADPETGEVPVRDADVEVLALCEGLGPNDTLTIAGMVGELNGPGKAYLAQGPIAAASEKLANEGAIRAVPLGDPMVMHFMRAHKRDDDLRRPVCMEIAGLPPGDELHGMAMVQVVGALVDRYPTRDFTPEQVLPVLEELIKLGILGTREIDVPMELPADAPADAVAATAKVLFYDFAPGVLFKVLAEGLDGLIAPSAVAARQGGHAVRAAALAEELEALKMAAKRTIAERDAATAKVATWRKRLEDRGLADIIAELEAPPAPAKDDPRGKPYQFRERLPITDGLARQFFVDSTKIRQEIHRCEAQALTSKENAAATKKSMEARIAELNGQIDELEIAYAGGHYLLVTQAYRVFNPATRETEIHAWADDRLIKVETKADVEANVPKGGNVEIPTVVKGPEPAPEAPKAAPDGAKPPTTPPAAPAATAPPATPPAATAPKAGKGGRKKKP